MYLSLQVRPEFAYNCLRPTAWTRSIDASLPSRISAANWKLSTREFFMRGFQKPSRLIKICNRIFELENIDRHWKVSIEWTFPFSRCSFLIFSLRHKKIVCFLSPGQFHSGGSMLQLFFLFLPFILPSVQQSCLWWSMKYQGKCFPGRDWRIKWWYDGEHSEKLKKPWECWNKMGMMLLNDFIFLKKLRIPCVSYFFSHSNKMV